MSDDDESYPSEEDDVDLTPLHQPPSKKNESRAEKRKAEAQERIARREKLNIRFSSEEIERIYAAAERNQSAVMPMLRKWVLSALVCDEGLMNSASAKQISGKFSVLETGQQYHVGGGSAPHADSHESTEQGRVDESRLASVETALNQLARALRQAGFTAEEQ